MSLSTFHFETKFLFDENVDKRLENFLKNIGVDVLSKPKGLKNGKLAEFSKTENRILVTNDEDFIHYSKRKIFSLVWLRIPQNNIEILKEQFANMIKNLNKQKDFEGKIILLNEKDFEITSLEE